MLFATQHKSTTEALKYFEKVLSTGDYYLGKEINANWHGRLAAELGLDTSKPVSKEDFEALLKGKHPTTGKNLLQRMRKDRRPGIDFTLSVPKSVSAIYAINKDERILDILSETVRETLEKHVEPLVHRRVRDGLNVRTDNRKRTGKMLFADFTHLTSRPVDGVPDPHLHVHAFAVNATEDDGRYFAADYTEVMRQLPFIQSAFDASFAAKLEQRLGLRCEHTTYLQGGKRKKGWEVSGVSRKTILKFSKRTLQIEAYAQKHNITSAEAKSKLGKLTREGKEDGLTLTELRAIWLARLTHEEREAFEALRAGEVGRKSVVEVDRTERIAAAVKFSLDHHLERQATAEKHAIVATALDHGLVLQPEEITDRLEAIGVIQRSREVDGTTRDYITTPEVLQAEQDMIAFARDGRGTRNTLGHGHHEFKRDWLNDQQRAAIAHILSSTDTVTIVSGGAGTGKTSMMKEASEALESANKSVMTFAPSTGAREVLHEEGFANAETVEHLIRNTKLHGEINAGDVLWIDEASLLDTKSMSAIFSIADAHKARVVLSGDVRQHSSVRRGEAMRLLQQHAKLDVVRIDKIQRQKGQYKLAVEYISQGKNQVKPGITGLEAGFRLLDKLGKIHELQDDARISELTTRYLEATKQGKSTLVVSPTHAEGTAVTQSIRERRIEAGEVGKEEREYAQLRSLNLSEAEKGEPASYSPSGQVVQFHQNAKGFKRGERYRVSVNTDGSVMLNPMAGVGEAKPLPVTTADRFEVYSETSVNFAKGDKIRFSLGGVAKDGKRRVSNGRLDEISGFDRWGNIRLKSGMTIGKDYAHMDLGYSVTSHAAQGKTTQVAIAAMGSESLAAINAKQFYVTASRGSDDIAIYVDDKAKVLRSIQDAGLQLAASDLVSEMKDDAEYNRSLISKVQSWWQEHRPQRKAASPAQSPPTYSKPELSR